MKKFRGCCLSLQDHHTKYLVPCPSSKNSIFSNNIKYHNHIKTNSNTKRIILISFLLQKKKKKQKHSLMMLKVSCFFLPMFFSFIHIYSATNSSSSFTTCPTYSCDDGLKIRYPFWLSSQGSTSDYQYCGYQEFGLLCAHGHPILPIIGKYYYVTNIDYDSHTLHLVDYDTLNQTCPRALHSVPLGSLPLSHSPLNFNLSFHYNCSSYPSDASPIGCLTSGLNESFVFVEGNETVRGFDWSRSCEISVTVTVMKEYITSDGLMNEYKEAMNKGFVLDWQTSKSCVECEASGGLCGYSNTKKEVLCFCNDGNIQSNSCSGM